MENMTVNQTNGHFSPVDALSQLGILTCPLPDAAKLKIALRLITELIIDDMGERDSDGYFNLISVIFPFQRARLDRKYAGRGFTNDDPNDAGHRLSSSLERLVAIICLFLER